MKRCPECDKDNQDDARGCAFCPATFPDPDNPEQVKKFRRFDPASWPIAVWLLAFVGCGLLTWKGIDSIMSVGAEGLKNPLLLVNRKLETMNKDSAIAQPVIQAHQAAQDAAAKSSAPAYTVGSTSNAASVSWNGQADAPAAPKPDQPAKREPQPGDWKLSGTVYDLVTLQPLSGCVMAFKGKSARFEAVTDDAGHYDLPVPPPHGGGGYLVEISRPGYARSYLNPATENVKEKSAEDRAEMAKDLSTSDGGQYPVEAGGSDTLTTDFYLAPKS
jgi:hypothetical protein